MKHYLAKQLYTISLGWDTSEGTEALFSERDRRKLLKKRIGEEAFNRFMEEDLWPYFLTRWLVIIVAVGLVIVIHM